MTGGARRKTFLRKQHALQLFKTDMCKFFLQGRCENGDQCFYAHNIDEVRHKPDLTRTSMCRTLLRAGHCSDDSCRFAHDESQLRASHGFFKVKMCGFAQAGRCKNGQDCHFAHSPEELRPMNSATMGGNGEVLQSAPQCGSTPTAAAAARQPVLLEQEEPAGPDAEEAAAEPEPSASPSAEAAKDESESPAPRGRGAGSARPSARGRAAARGGWDGSDSADGSSLTSGGGSSVTEVPRSEHTGTRSPPTTSDSSSRIGKGSSGPSATRVSGSASTAASRNSGGLSGGSGGTSAGEPSSQRPKAKASPGERRIRTSHGGSTSSQGLAGEGEAKVNAWLHENRVACSLPQATTLLVNNVPNYLTQGALLSMFEDLAPGMRGSFNFFYCPWDEKVRRNLGYAIINFSDADQAHSFQQSWSSKELCRGVRGQKPLKIVKASLQGLQANLEYFAKMDMAYCHEIRFRPLFRDASGILQPLQLEPVNDAAQVEAFAPLFERSPASAGVAAQELLAGRGFRDAGCSSRVLQPPADASPRRAGRRAAALYVAGTEAVFDQRRVSGNDISPQGASVPQQQQYWRLPLEQPQQPPQQQGHFQLQQAPQQQQQQRQLLQTRYPQEEPLDNASITARNALLPGLSALEYWGQHPDGTMELFGTQGQQRQLQAQPPQRQQQQARFQPQPQPQQQRQLLQTRYPQKEALDHASIAARSSLLPGLNPLEYWGQHPDGSMELFGNQVQQRQMQAQPQQQHPQQQQQSQQSQQQNQQQHHQQQQQSFGWPVLMTPVPWPVAEHQELLANGCGGYPSGQVPHTQLMQCMMMPIDPLGRPGTQGAWPGSDDVYSD